MKKLVVSISDNIVSGKYYSYHTDKYYKNYYVFKSLTDICDKFSNGDIVSFEVINDKNLRIIYKDCIIELIDADRVLERYEMRNLSKKLTDYIAKEEIRIRDENLKRVKHKKAKRKSKTGKVVFVGAVLGSLLFALCVVSTNSFELIDENNKFSFPIESIVEYDSDFTEHVNKDDSFDFKQFDIPEIKSDFKSLLDDKGITGDFSEVHGNIGLVNDNEEKKVADITKSSIRNINMCFEDRTDTQKAKDTRANYGELLTKYANIYGVDPNIMIAMATQEKGVHATTIDDGGGVGLMQLQYDVWVGHSISAYNFETGKIDKFEVNDSNIRDLENNVRFACMITQGKLKDMNFNLPAALQAYNWGTVGATSMISSYAEDCGISFDEVLGNNADTTFLNYFGNYVYANLVLSYVDTTQNIVNYKLGENGEKVPVTYHINNSYQKDFTY